MRMNREKPTAKDFYEEKSKAIPPFMRLANELRSTITSENMQPGSFLGTEVEITKNCGLSRMTVRRAVKLLIDEGLLERIAGRGVFVRDKKRQTRLVKMLAGNLCWIPSANIAHGAQSVAVENGIELSLFDAHGDTSADLAAIKLLPCGGSVGAIVMSLHSKEFYRELCVLVSKNFPVVVVDDYLNEISISSVSSDNKEGGRLAMKALLDNGHTNIAFVGDLSSSTTRLRYDGALEVLTDHGLQFTDVRDLIVKDRLGDWDEKTTNIIRIMLTAKNRPEAIFCSCDSIARSIYKVAKKLELRIPEDLSVVGFDDDPISEWLNPPLTTIKQDFNRIGEEAMKQIISLISAHRQIDEVKNIVVPVSLVERASIKKKK